MRPSSKKIQSLTIALFALILPLCGCSTIAGRQNNEQMVLFNSNIPGVIVNCSGKKTATPGNLSLKQSRNHACSAKFDGYESKYFRVLASASSRGFKESTSLNTRKWGWWTLGIGTVTGWIVDYFSGAMRDFEIADYYLEMEPSGTSSTAEKIFDKTVHVGKTLITAPIDVLDNSAGAIVDTTVRGSAEKIGADSAHEEVRYPSTQEPKKI